MVVVSFALAAIAGALFGGVAATAGSVHVPARGTTVEEWATAFEREREAAERLGLSVDVEHTVELSTGGADVLSVTVPVRERECVAIVTQSSGSRVVRHLDLSDRARDPALRHPLVTDGSSGIVKHVQWCQLAPVDLHLHAFHEPRDGTWDGQAAPGALRYAILRGDWDEAGGFDALERGTLGFDGDRAIATREHALATAPARLIVERYRQGPPVELSVDDGAWLLPPSQRTYEALFEASRRHFPGSAVNPRTHGSHAFHPPAGVDASELPPAHDPLIDLARAAPSRFRRVLLVVDFDAEERDCVRLTFTRLVYGHAAAVAFVQDLDAEPQPVSEDAHVATFARCGLSGVGFFVVAETNQAAFQIQQWDAEPLRQALR